MLDACPNPRKLADNAISPLGRPNTIAGTEHEREFRAAEEHFVARLADSMAVQGIVVSEVLPLARVIASHATVPVSDYQAITFARIMKFLAPARSDVSFWSSCRPPTWSWSAIWSILCNGAHQKACSSFC